MPSICFYFQVHQPNRLRNYNFFDIGDSDDYFDTARNVEILNKVAEKCYLPANETFYNLIKKYDGEFKIALSLSGVLLEQLENWRPDVLYSFRKLVDTGCVELLAETYYHSLSSVYAPKEFEAQVAKHERMIRRLFGVSPQVFRNTELIYNNELSKTIHDFGFNGIIAEGVAAMMTAHSSNFVHHPPGLYDFPVLLKNYKLSDDIAFRFSNMEWSEYPLTADKFSHWIHQFAGNGETINLFMDYETFGEHQWETTGIFNFLNYLPQHVLSHPDFTFSTPSEVIEKYPIRGAYDVPKISSWADTERDLSAWAGNPMQKEALRRFYDLETPIKNSGDWELLENWRKLSTSDHFYYMCTKGNSDGEVHEYFSPYKSPIEAYNFFINILTDLEYRVSKVRKPILGAKESFLV
ncbi:MAG: alpha-amylase [Saprospiraceae bacterium]|jgi:alpha-amylase